MDRDTEGSPFDRSEACPLVPGREAGKGAQMRAAGSFGSEQMKEHLSAGSCFLRIKQDGHLRLRGGGGPVKWPCGGGGGEECTSSS